MQESRQLRRAWLAREIEARACVLDILRRAGREAFDALPDEAQVRMVKTFKELQRFKAELHELNIQQIREEMNAGQDSMVEGEERHESFWGRLGFRFAKK